MNVKIVCNAFSSLYLSMPIWKDERRREKNCLVHSLIDNKTNAYDKKFDDTTGSG